MGWAWMLDTRVVALAALLLACGAGVGAVRYHQRAVGQAYRAGQVQARDSVQREAAVQVQLLTERLRVATGRTDTVVQRVTRTVARVDTLLQAVHDTLWVQLPAPAQEALAACRALVQDCGQVRAALVAERAAADSVRQATQLQRTADKDSIRTLAKRPSRLRHYTTVAAVGLLGVWAGGR
jgi:hypothetical protein